MDSSQKEYIFQFFVLFSKLEYALKMAGHHRGEGNAQADWEKFGSAIESEFRNDPPDEVTKQITYLTIDNPPKKQVVHEGKLKWSTTPPSSTTETGKLFLYVCRVRNNLFHGGKYQGHFLSSPDRTKELITACTTILKHALSVSPEVASAMGGGADN